MKLLLFTDILIVAKQAKDKNKKRLVLDVLHVDQMVVNDIPDDPGKQCSIELRSLGTNLTPLLICSFLRGAQRELQVHKEVSPDSWG